MVFLRLGKFLAPSALLRRMKLQSLKQNAELIFGDHVVPIQVSFRNHLEATATAPHKNKTIILHLTGKPTLGNNTLVNLAYLGATTEEESGDEGVVSD